jgi:hypothetical protein
MLSRLVDPCLRGISVVYEFCDLWVKLDMCQAHFTLTWKKIKKWSNYLNVNMWYYAKDLCFKNQYLLWSAEMRPYYVYAAPFIET